GEERPQALCDFRSTVTRSIQQVCGSDASEIADPVWTASKESVDCDSDGSVSRTFGGSCGLHAGIGGRLATGANQRERVGPGAPVVAQRGANRVSRGHSGSSPAAFDRA